MGRIAASISGIELRLLNSLARANAATALGSLRLASGHNITSPADNPAAFVALSQLRSEQSGVAAAIKNVTAASTLVSQTQLVLDQIRTQLNTIRGKAIEDQDQALDSETRAANQADIDAAIAKINQLASTTIGGRRILDGSADFTYTGVNNTQLAHVSATSLGSAATRTISGTVTTPATRAQLVHTEVSGSITSDATISLAGERGEVSIAFNNGDSLATAAQKVNDQSDLTGVTASVVGNDLRLTSIDYGSDATVEVSVTSGTFSVSGTAVGIDAIATLNGQSIVGVGNKFSANENGFAYSIEFQGGFSGAFSTVTVSGQALSFALSPDVGQLATLAIPALQPSRLGGPSGTLADLQTGGSLVGLGANTPLAVRVADEALAQLTAIEARVDGFADVTIDSSSALLSGFNTNLQEAIDSIDEVDPALELLLSRQNQALAANALAGLSILTQQRTNILSLLQQIAFPLGSAHL